ncbi:MAG: hypothetical protein AABY22_20155, partial [Nanoarchaeota archaeon]
TGVSFFISGKNFIPEILYSTGDETVKINFGEVSAFLYRINEVLLSGTLPESAISGKISIYKKDGQNLYPSNTYLNIIDSPPIPTDFYPNSIRSGENFYGFIYGKNLLLSTGVFFSGISSGTDGNTGSFFAFGTGNFKIDSNGLKLNISGATISGLNTRTGIHSVAIYNSVGDRAFLPNNKYLLIYSSGFGIINLS